MQNNYCFFAIVYVLDRMRLWKQPTHAHGIASRKVNLRDNQPERLLRRNQTTELIGTLTW
jgi:hypothetical protein